MLRISDLQSEGILRVSKFLKHQVLLDAEEMEALFAHLGKFFLYVVSDPVSAEEMECSQSRFLALYKMYVEGLKEVKLQENQVFRRDFSSIWTVDSSILYALSVGKEKFLVKSTRPILQLQLHRFLFSEVDEKIHPLVLGKESISWGIQFSYPQLYQEPKSREIYKVPREFPNSIFYWQLSRWLRNHTVPAAFFFESRRVYSPLRLGKKCISWIGHHSELKNRGLRCVWS